MSQTFPKEKTFQKHKSVRRVRTRGPNTPPLPSAQPGIWRTRGEIGRKVEYYRPYFKPKFIRKLGVMIIPLPT